MKKTTLAMAMMAAMGWQAPALAGMTMEERMQRMEQRMQYLEQRVRDQDRAIKEKDARIEKQDERIEQLVSNPEIRKRGEDVGERWFDNVAVSGVIEVEASGTDNEDLFDNSADGDDSDIVLATAELGIDAQVNDWVNGNITFLYEEDDSDLEVDVATITIANADATPFFFAGGQMYVPFGAYETNMIADPLTLEIGETRETAALVGFAQGGFYGTAYVFNGDTDESGDDEIDNFGANAGFSGEFDNGDFDVSVSYINDIGDSDALQDTIPGGIVDDEVAGFGVSAVANIGDFTLIGEYVTALDDFEFAELPFDGDGAEPSAWNLEAGYNFALMGKDSTIAIAYQETDEALALELPEQRLSLALSVGIFDNTALTFEYAHDDNYGSSDGGNGDDANTLTGQLAYGF